MRVRILHVLDTLGKGGLENGVVNLVNSLDADRFEHVICAMRSLGENAGRLPGRVCLRRLEEGARHSRIQVGALARVVREVRPTIVHSRNWGTIEAVVAARWVRGCSVVHGEHGHETGDANREPLRRAGFRRLAYELADRVIAVSYELRDFHARRTGFSRNRVGVIHNGVDSRRFAPDPPGRLQVRAELGIAEGTFCIGAVGSLFPIKDHMTLLRAVDALDRACHDWRLLLIGEGPEQATLESWVSGHPGWRARVTFLGTSNRVPELLNAMDGYVLPSINEGISNSLLEAMATGLPVIASRAGGNPEVVGEAVSGLLFGVGKADELVALLTLLQGNPELRLRLGEQARRRVQEEFSLASMVKQYERLYLSLIPAGMAQPAAARA